MYSYENITDILKEIKHKYNIKKEKVSIILDFTKFYISFFEAPYSNKKEENELLDNFLLNEIDDYQNKNFIIKKLYINHPQNKYIIFSTRKDFINNIKILFKSFGFIITDITVDIIPIYKFYEHENISILNIGNDLSSLITIKDNILINFKTINIDIKDIHNINSYDFIQEEEKIVILDYSSDCIDNIFNGNKLNNTNFLSNTYKLSFTNIKIYFIFLLIILIFIIFNSLLSFDHLNENMKVMKEDITILQEKFLFEKEEVIIDYSKEIEQLNEIIKNMRYHNHYKFIKHLIKESNINIGFSKILYENNSWIIEGDALKFKDIEKFETTLNKYAQSIELIFIKSNSEFLIFQYKISDILWN